MVRKAKLPPRNEWAERAEAAAADLHALAADIQGVADTLSRWRNPAVTKEVLEQHARRAKAIAAALTVEAWNPQPETTGLLLKAGKAVGKGAMVVLLTLGTGAGEQAGGDIYIAAKDRAVLVAGEARSKKPVRPASIRPESRVSPPRIDTVQRPQQILFDRFGPRLRAIRLGLGLSQREVAEPAGVSQQTLSRWEAGFTLPQPGAFRRTLRVLESLGVAPQIVGDLDGDWSHDNQTLMAYREADS